MKLIKDLVKGEAYCYGYIKITHLLRKKYNLIINKKKVYRICKQLRILKPQREIKPKYPRKIAINRVINDSNQLWEADIKYGYITSSKKFFYILSFIDVFDRSIIDFHIGLNCTAKDAKETLINSLVKRNLLSSENKPIIRTDNGTQFTSNTFKYTCEKLNIHHEQIPVKTPNKNAHIESFHNLLQNECLKYFSFASFKEAYKEVVRYIDYYNNIRIHSSIGYMAPMEFYRENLSNTKKKLVVKV
jgi:putative transposase